MNDKRRVFINSLVVTFSTIFDKFLFFIIGILIARFLSVENFGIYSTALGLATYFSLISDLGINYSLVRVLNLKQDKRNALFTAAFILKIVLNIAAYGILILYLIFTNYNDTTISLALIFGLVRMGNEFHRFFYSVFDSKESFVFSGAMNSFFSVVFFASTVYIIFENGDVFDFAVVRLVIVLFFLFLISFITLRKVSLKIEWILIKEFILETLPFSYFNVFKNTIERLNIIIISLIHGTLLTGIFSNAYLFYNTLGFIPENFNRILTPYLYKIDFKKNSGKFQFAFDVFSKIFGISSFYISLIFFLFSKLVITYLFGAKYSDSIPVLTIISIGIPFLFNISTIIITALDKQKANTRIYGIATAFSIIANIVFIYYLKAEGAALATVLTFGLIFFLSHGYIRQMGYISLKKTIRGYGILIGVSLVCLLTHKLFLIQFHWIIGATGVTVLYGLLVLLLMVRTDDIRIVKEIFIGAKSK